MGKNKKMVDVRLVEILKKPGIPDRKRTVDGVLGLLDVAFIGGIWMERKSKVGCPECHGHHTSVSVGFCDVEFSSFTLNGGEIEGLGNLVISCKDCKKDFSYSSCHSLPFDFVESATFEEMKQFREKTGSK